ncbi:hypothetical protein [Paraclostridium bifermentans]|uniref:hypothetical protein n=1 Tax=Paraclostridium bifermentans TaxID=1490 RepID=UPI0025B23F7B|nr:hypothetical protein [Paraclostridium bifermentans]
MKIVFDSGNIDSEGIAISILGIVGLLTLAFTPYDIGLTIFFRKFARLALVFVICGLVFQVSKGFRTIRNKKYLANLIYFLDADSGICGKQIDYKLEKAEIKYIKELVIIKVQEKVERVLDGKVSEYVYSKKYIEKNFITVLTLAVLTIKTNSDKKLETNIKHFTTYIKGFCNMSFNDMNLDNLEMILSKFDDILEYDLN